MCIGDAGYPLEPWLMTPLPHYPERSRQYHYNEKLCKARSIVERFFGVLKGTWRCLSFQRVLIYAMLHNMRLHYRLPLDEEEEQEDMFFDNAPADHMHVEEEIEIRRRPRAIAQRIQKQLMQEWFPIIIVHGIMNNG